MLVPGMLFQDESANKLQHVLCEVWRDFYRGPSGKQLLDWPRWEEWWIPARDQMLVALAARKRDLASLAFRFDNRGDEMANWVLLAFGEFIEDWPPRAPRSLKRMAEKLRGAGGDIRSITNGINQALAELMDDMDRAAFEAACPIDEPVRPDRSKDPDSSSKRRRKPAMGPERLRNLRYVDSEIRNVDRLVSKGPTVADLVAQVFGTTAVVAPERPPVPLKQWPASAAATVLMNWDTHYFSIQSELARRPTLLSEGIRFRDDGKQPLSGHGKKHLHYTHSNIASYVQQLKDFDNYVDSVGGSGGDSPLFFEVVDLPESNPFALVTPGKKEAGKPKKPTAISAAKLKRMERAAFSSLTKVPILIQAAVIRDLAMGLRDEGAAFKQLDSMGVFKHVARPARLADMNNAVLLPMHNRHSSGSAPMTMEHFNAAVRQATEKFLNDGVRASEDVPGDAD